MTAFPAATDPPLDHVSPLPLTLGEGNTPLLRSRAIGPAAGLPNLYFKLETTNPTGSYKDRFAVAAINEMLRLGQTRIIACSSGNAGAALAAYAAAADMTCEIAVVITAPPGKLKQMQAYGAHLYKVEGFGVDPEITVQTMETLQQMGTRPGSALQITAYRYCPVGMAGVESISLELAAQFTERGVALDHMFVCAGGGGLGLAVARGFDSAVNRGLLPRGPRLHCVQPAGNNTIAGPLRAGATKAQACQSTTSISGLQVASVIDGDELLTACRHSGGTGFLVSDEEVLQLQQELARREGIFCEPAAAVSLAGVLQAARQGEIAPTETVACLITGSGFKDQAALDRMLAQADCPVWSVPQFQTHAQSLTSPTAGSVD